MPPRTLATRLGKTYIRGDKIGEGGEGEIYTVENSPNYVIKLYFQDKLNSKEEKINEMIPLCPDYLRKFASIPLESLYDHRNQFAGFLMDLIDGIKLHEFLSKNRPDAFQKARWNFFVRVAKNLARSVYELHKKSFVVGDINESNIFVLSDATVRIIDFDSSQFKAPNGKEFRCEVGKIEYLAPELQNVNRDVLRNQSHDCFSLAVVIFQILFLNRHPFSGIPQTTRHLSFSETIQEHRFAFGSDSKTRGFLPPPYIINLEETSKHIEGFFRKAFLSENSRPTAKDWINALNELEKNLTECKENNGHFYPQSVLSCPWCRIEEESNYQIIHFDPKSFDTNFDLNEVWKEICSISPSSAQIALPEKIYYELEGREKLKAQINSHVIIKIGLCIAVLIIQFALLFLIAKAEMGCAIILTLILSFITGSIIFAILDSGNLFPKFLFNEKKQLEQQNKQLLEDYEKLQQGQSFNAKFRELETKKDEYLNLGTFRANRFQELENQARERQEVEFLSKFRISDASIPLIGYSRELTLQSFGIETAADLTLSKIYSVPGFGYTLAHNLMDWKNSKRNQFVFNPNQAITKADEIAIEREIYRRKVNLERDLKRGKRILENTLKGDELAEKKLYQEMKLNLQKSIDNEYKFAPTISSLISKISIVYLIFSTIAMITFVVANRPEISTIADQNENSSNVANVATEISPEPTESTLVSNDNDDPNKESEESEDVIAFKRGVSKTRSGEFEEAVEFYEKAILKNPKYAQAFHELGYAHLRLGNYRESIEASKKAIELNPKKADTFRNLATAYQATQNLEEACKNYSTANSISPNHLQTLQNLGNCYLKKGELDSAIRAFKNLTKIRPNDANAHFELGKILYRTGRFEEAKSEYTALQKINPAFAQKFLSETGMKPLQTPKIEPSITPETKPLKKLEIKP